LLTQYKVLKAARKIIAAFCGKKFGKVIKLWNRTAVLKQIIP
jgi:hypothetical protein